jgi:hypothetical protein
MHDERSLSLAWMRVGGVCGLLGGLAYFAAAFLPLPEILAYAAAFAFGPLLAIGAMGLYHGLALRHRGPMVQIAAVFAVAGGCTVLIMLTVQQSIFALNQRAIDAATDPAVAEHFRLIGRGLNSVQLGIDVAWDVLISVAVVLFGLAMLRHPHFGRVFGALGAVLGLLLLVYNLRYFPVPPIDAESIDWGPAVAIWLLVAFGLLLRAARKERLAPAP